MIRLVPTVAPRVRDLVLLCRAAVQPDSRAVELALIQAFQEPGELVKIEVLPPLERELEAFAAAIRTGAPLSTGARDGLAVVGMLEGELVDLRAQSDGTGDVRTGVRLEGLEP